MDQAGQSVETLIYAAVPSGPAIGLDTLSDSTTFASPTTPTFILSGSLPGGSQSPSISSTTTPLDGCIPGIASSSLDYGIADISLNKLKKTGREMKRFQCQYCDKV